MGLVARSACHSPSGLFVSHPSTNHDGAFKYRSYGTTLFARHVKRTLENLGAIDVTLTEEEITAVAKILDEHPVIGDRYFGEGSTGILWG